MSKEYKVVLMDTDAGGWLLNEAAKRGVDKYDACDPTHPDFMINDILPAFIKDHEREGWELHSVINEMKILLVRVTA